MDIMVVDDEWFARKALVKTIESWNPDARVIDVENSLDALDYMVKSAPDIVFTDIRMPEMDGLQLCEYIRNNRIDSHIVIVSGYSEFEYAQKAIQYGVNDYLLKPVNDEKVFAILNEIVQNRKLRLMKQYELANMQEKMKLLARQDALNRLLFAGGTDEQSFASLLPLTLEPGEFALAVVQMQSGTSAADQAAAMDAIARELPEGSGYSFPNIVRENEWILLGFEFGERNDQTALILAKRMESAINTLQSISVDGIYIGVSGAHSMINEMNEAYREAKYALHARLVQSRKQVFCYETGACSHDMGVMDAQREKLLMNKLLNNQLPSFKHQLSKMFQQCSDSVDAIRRLYLDIGTVIRRAAFSVDSDPGLHHIQLKDIGEFTSLEQLIDETVAQVEQLWFGGMAGNDLLHADQIVEDMKCYVEENYYHFVLLKVLARERYFMNAEYLSRLFKQRTGESFSRYLTNVRMNHAKMLLDRKEYTISEVSTLVGYNSLSHFIQSYKKYYGRTPSGK